MKSITQTALFLACLCTPAAAGTLYIGNGQPGNFQLQSIRGVQVDGDPEVYDLFFEHGNYDQVTRPLADYQKSFGLAPFLERDIVDIPANAVTTETIFSAARLEVGCFDCIDYSVHVYMRDVNNPVLHYRDADTTDWITTVPVPDGTAWLTYAPALRGDANNDGVFDSADLINVMGEGVYENGEPAGWNQGDWDRDGFFTSSDLITALATGAYEATLPLPAASVPEPSISTLALLGLLILRLWNRNHGWRHSLTPDRIVGDIS